MVEKIPLQMRELPQWIVSKPVVREDGKIDIPPLSSVTGYGVDPCNPCNWSSFDQSVATGMPYIGFCLSHSDPYTIIDLDDKAEKPATDEQRAFFGQLIQAFGSYTEVSRSGRGYHIVVRGRIPVGRRSDKHKIEVYSADRYFVMTGNVIPGYTEIVDGQRGLDWLMSQVLSATIPGHHSYELDQHLEQPETDQEMMNRMAAASNADKIIALWNGSWQQFDYPSQSEADMALMDILCHYSPNDEQCRRMFRFSQLGQREKAKRNNYLDFMLRKKRVEQIEVDYSQLLPIKKPVSVATESEPMEAPTTERETTSGVKQLQFAPGALGWLQWYSYCSAERPALDISLAAAIGFLSGMVGRSYNCERSGLNQYILLLAPTGTGKDELGKLPERIINQLSDTIPAIKDFRGPGTFASGQALIKRLNKQSCFCSVMGEFAETIAPLCGSNLSSADSMLKRALLMLYSSSGADGTLQSMAYSDADKTTDEVKSPALTMLAETAPEKYFAALSEEQIDNGLLPRFLTIDYRGMRPPANPNSGMKMPQEMKNWLVELASICLSQSQRGGPIQVQMDPEAAEILRKGGDFDTNCDNLINNGDNSERQLWNRAHLKAIRLAGLVAAVTYPHQPVVTKEFAAWAVELVTRDIKAMLKRFEEGVGEGDAKQLADLRKALWQYKESSPEKVMESYGIKEAAVRSGLVPYVYLQRKLAGITSFRKDRAGSSVAINRSLATLIATGEIVEASREKALSLGYSGKLYICNFGD